MKKKIGILMGSNTCDAPFSEFLDELLRYCNDFPERAELIALVHRQNGPRRKAFQYLKLKYFNALLFRLYSLFEALVERTIFGLQPANGSRLHLDQMGLKCIYITPQFSKSGAVVRYSEEDIQRLRSMNFDLLVRGTAPGIFRGSILGVGRCGILSFHHGDNRWNRGGPPGFWEVYRDMPSTGFILQVLSEQLDAGRVVFRGALPTRRTYVRNVQALYAASYPWLWHVVNQFIESGALPEPEPTLETLPPVLTTPTPIQLFEYCTMRVKYLLSRAAAPIGTYHIGFFAGEVRSESFSKATLIPNPKGRFLADPFVVYQKERQIIFAEDYCFKSKKASISAVEILPEGGSKYLGPVVEEPFHLSYPFLFKFGESLYMVPESADDDSVRLYRCVEFPLKWRFEKCLMKGVKALDTNIFEFNDLWWLLTTHALSGGSNTSVLYAYSADSPLSDLWQKHPMNPVVFDSECARNGGFLPSVGERLLRVRQRHGGMHRYGERVTIAEVTSLSRDSFSERIVESIRPGLIKGMTGLHHLHSNGEITVFDCFGKL